MQNANLIAYAIFTIILETFAAFRRRNRLLQLLGTKNIDLKFVFVESLFSVCKQQYNTNSVRKRESALIVSETYCHIPIHHQYTNPKSHLSCRVHQVL